LQKRLPISKSIEERIFMAAGYQKISVNLSDPVIATLKRLAEQDAVTVTEVLRRAISTHNFVEEAQSEGKLILVKDPKSKVVERVVFR
jgi:uncharacterized membrane protein